MIPLSIFNGHVPGSRTFPAELVARVSGSSEAHRTAGRTAGRSPCEEVVRDSAEVIGLVLDACPTSAALEELDRRSRGRFTDWLPDVAIDLGRSGHAADGAALLARLARTLGYRPFPIKLLEGMIEGMARWGGEDGTFEIDLPPERLARLVVLLFDACPGIERLQELSSLLGRPVWDWHAQAAEQLCRAGGIISLGGGRSLLVGSLGPPGHAGP